MPSLIAIKQINLQQLSGFITGIAGVGGQAVYISGSGVNYASGTYVFITDGTNYVSGDITINGGSNYFISGTNYLSGINYISGGDNYISDGENYISGGDNYISGSSVVISGGNNIISGSGVSIYDSSGINIFPTSGESIYLISGNNEIFGGFNTISGGPNYITGSENNIYGNVNSISGGTNILSGSVKVALSFWMEYPLSGLYQQEFFVSDPITFTGYKIGAIYSGRGPAYLSSGASGVPLWGPLSGSYYQRSKDNQVTNIVDFSFTSGIIYKESGNYNVTISGGNRVGINIYSGLSGLQSVTFGIFGHQSYVTS
jgi:membrane-bound inhibitor of C-type lysozyme